MSAATSSSSDCSPTSIPSRSRWRPSCPPFKKGILVQPGMAQRAQRQPEHAVQHDPVLLSADRERQPDDRRVEVGAAQRRAHPSGPALQPATRWRSDTSAIAPPHARSSATRAASSRSRPAKARWPSGVGNEADLGTAFALATSLYGNNMLQVSGNLGLRLADRRSHRRLPHQLQPQLGGGSPEVSVTMRQLFLPGRLGAALAGNDSALPMLRSMSASFDDRTQLTDELSRAVRLHPEFDLLPGSPELRQPVRAPDLFAGRRRASWNSPIPPAMRGPIWPARAPGRRPAAAS